MLISDALAVCNKCPTQGQEGCKLADFQSGKKEEYKYQIPACITQAQNPKGIKQNKPKKSDKKVLKEDPHTKQSTLLDIKKIRTIDVPWQWDELDRKIIQAIVDKYNVNGIVRIVSGTKEHIPKGTVQYRIKRMEKEGLITAVVQHVGLRRVKLFNITPKARKLLSLPEESQKTKYTQQKPENNSKNGLFTAHKNTIRFPVVRGVIPTSPKPYKMKNWTGYIFEGEDGSHTIATTTKSIIVHINIDIGTHSVSNLIMKYSDLARGFAGKFAERYNLELGYPDWLRESDITSEDSAIARALTEMGNFRSSSVEFNRSQSSAEAEFKPGQALGFESLINDVPRAVEQIENKIDRVIAHHNTTTDKAEAIENGIIGVSQKLDQLPVVMAMLRENMELKMQVKEYQGIIVEIKGELTNIKTQMSEMGWQGNNKQTPPKNDKWGYNAYA